MSMKNQLQELCQKYGLPLPDYEQMSNTGPSHSPSFVFKVTVKLNDEVLTETAEGRRKKDAQQYVADKMFKRIRALKGIVEGVYSESTVYSDVSPASPSHCKNNLQELLQKHGLPLPVYKCLPVRGPSHSPTFTIKLTVLSANGAVLWEGNGDGRTKKEAETSAARVGLQYFQEYLESGTPITPLHTGRRSYSPPRGEVDAGTDEDIKFHLSQYHPVYTTKKVEDVWLCMSLTTGFESPVASHGQGTSPDEAERDASLNLNHNIQKLYSVHTMS